MSSKRIGEFLAEKKILTPLEVEQVLEYGSREGLRFGEAGMKLGLLSEESLVNVFGKNYRVDFFHLDSRYFPRKTSDILSLDTILRYGVLPLGFKNEYGLFKHGKKILNLGMIDPGRDEALQLAETQARQHADITRTQIFLVLADQFLDVLNSVYGVTSAEIARRPADQLDPTLAMFLEERA